MLVRSFGSNSALAAVGLMGLAGGCSAPEEPARRELEGLRAEHAALRQRLRRSDGARLLAEASVAAATDPGLALGLALAGARAGEDARSHAVLQQVLDRLHERRVFAADSHAVAALAYAPDETRIATGGREGVVRVWDVSSGALRHALDHQEQGVRSVAWSPTGGRLATRTSNGWFGVRLWNVETGDCIATLVGAGAPCFSPDGALLAAPVRGGVVGVWRAADGGEVFELEGHRGRVTAVAFSPSRPWLASVSADGVARLVDRNGDVQCELAAHRQGLTAVAFNPAGAQLAVGSLDGTASLWDVDTGEQQRRLSAVHAVRRIEYSADGSRLLLEAAASERSTTRRVSLWDCATGVALAVWEDGVTAARFSSEGDLVAVAHHSGEVLLADAMGQRLATLRGHHAAVVGIEFSPDQASVATGSLDGTARVWSLRSGLARRTLGPFGASLGAAAFDPTGRRVAVGTDLGLVVVCDAATGGELMRLESHRESITALCYSSDGALLASSGTEGTVVLWDLETGLEQAVLEQHRRAVTAVAFSSDGRRVLTASLDATVVVWDAATGEPIATLEERGGVLTAVFSGDGRRVLTTTAGADASLFDASTGLRLAEFTGHRGRLTGAVLAAGERLVVTASMDRNARVYDATTGELKWTLEHRGAVTHLVAACDQVLTGTDRGELVSWAPSTGARQRVLAGGQAAVTGLVGLADCALVAASSVDGRLRIWRLADGAPRAVLDAGAAIVCLAVSPDGARLVSGAPDGRALLWPVDVRAAALRALPREFTVAQRRRFMVE